MPSFWTSQSDRLLSLLRVITGLLFLEHGTMKMLNFPPSEMFGGGPPESFTMIWFAGVLELVGGVLIALGLFTRPVAFILSGQMAFAYFIAHAPQSPYPTLNGGESAILFCFVFLYFSAAGGGALSLDRVLKRA
ncbi:MAG: DoxX family protein [Terricaulis sp.]